MVVLLIWLAYLLADWAAIFAVGLISNSQKGIRQRNSSNPDDHVDILAFWAPFLLLHIGGPETITAFALENNALWLRHLVGLISQVAAAFLAFRQSFPKNKLWVSTVLLFVAGIIKCAERTRALFLAKLMEDKFRRLKLKAVDPGPNYAKLMVEYSSKKHDAKLPAQIELIPEPNKESRTKHYAVDERRELDDLSVVKHAYHFFVIFNGLIMDPIFSFHERDESRLFFQNRTPEDALKVLAVELNMKFCIRRLSWCIQGLDTLSGLYPGVWLWQAFQPSIQ
jgi:hypothetical protein